MGEPDAIGGAATACLIARAAEPHAGEGDGHTHEAKCLNCGCELTGEFCQCCGQKAHVHRTVGAFFHDLAHGVLHFEGKIWRTLPLLVWRPGDLTRRYVEGERARFVSPIALFLFSVFAMFAVVSATGNLNPNIQAGVKELAESERAADAQIAGLSKKRAEVPSNSPTARKIDEKLIELRAERKLIADLRQKGVTQAAFQMKSDTFSSNVPWIEKAYLKAKRNPDLLIYKMKSNSYKWSWAIIPLSVPFLWLMFPFSKRFHLYDHVVFVTYSLCFMTLLVSVGTLLAAIGLNLIAPMMLLVPPFHMYRQLRGAYGLGRFGALWRTFGLMLSAVLVLIAFILLMTAVGVAD
jgi:hypothetical protein